jgi:hypothetical protein
MQCGLETLKASLHKIGPQSLRLLTDNPAEGWESVADQFALYIHTVRRAHTIVYFGPSSFEPYPLQTNLVVNDYNPSSNVTGAYATAYPYAPAYPPAPYIHPPSPYIHPPRRCRVSQTTSSRSFVSDYLWFVQQRSRSRSFSPPVSGNASIPQHYFLIFVVSSSICSEGILRPPRLLRSSLLGNCPSARMLRRTWKNPSHSGKSSLVSRNRVDDSSKKDNIWCVWVFGLDSLSLLSGVFYCATNMYWMDRVYNLWRALVTC